jgi:hypothetical protein
MGYQTDLSVSPASYQMAAADTEQFPFNAGEAIADASAVLVDRRSRREAGTLATERAGDTLTCSVGGLTYGDVYELIVTFTNGNGDTWSRTLVIECVA